MPPSNELTYNCSGKAAALGEFGIHALVQGGADCVLLLDGGIKLHLHGSVGAHRLLHSTQLCDESMASEANPDVLKHPLRLAMAASVSSQECDMMWAKLQ